MKVTNNSGVSLALAVMLLHDEYDYITGVENYISVTTLMKPIRQIILPNRIPIEARTADVEDFVSRALGKSIHDSMEKAWERGYQRSLKLLGYSDEVIGRIAINPTDEERKLNPDMIPVFLEQRTLRKIEVDGVTWTIGGKYDMVAEGIVQDTKSTSVWGWINGTRDDEHVWQMSQYRWLDASLDMPKITEDYGRVNYIFTDWAKMMARSNPNYPRRTEYKDIPLLSLDETERRIREKLSLVQQYRDRPEAEIPHCTDEELWRSAPKYKYFADPTKTAGRSTKNFDTMQEARAYQAEKGGKGIIIVQPGEVKACGYCQGFDACSQKDQYFS